MNDKEIIQNLAETCRMLATQGYGTSTSGNPSARLMTPNEFALTPTGVGFGDIDITGISIIDQEGRLLRGPRMTKEWAGHLAIYKAQPSTQAIIHVHAAHAIAASTLLKAGDVLPALTPQFVMRCGQVPIVPYHCPGSEALAGPIAETAKSFRA